MLWVLSGCLIAGQFGGVQWAWVAAPVAALAFLLRRDTVPAFLLLVALGCVCYLYSFASGPRPLPGAERASRGKVALSGWVCGIPRVAMGGMIFPLRVAAGGREHTIRVRAAGFGYRYADSLVVTARFDRVSSRYRRYLHGRGLAAAVRVRAGGARRVPSGASGGGGPIVIARRRVFAPVHHWARVHLSRGLGARASLPLALAIGERGLVSRRLKETYTDLGIAHLMALSGLHLGMVAAAILLVLRLARRRSRLLLLSSLALYVGIVGDLPSLQRAFVMAALWIGAGAVQRPLRPLAGLGGALFLMLAAAPRLIFSVAFQLSFLATAAVLVFIPAMPVGGNRSWPSRVGRWTVSILLMSAFVQLALAPVQLRYFGVVNPAAPVATLLFLPPVTVILVMSALTLVIDAAVPGWWPGLYQPLYVAAGVFEWGLHAAARILPGPVSLPAPSIAVFTAGMLLGILAWGRPRTVMIAGGIVALSFAVG